VTRNNDTTTWPARFVLDRRGQAFGVFYLRGSDREPRESEEAPPNPQGSPLPAFSYSNLGGSDR